MAAYAHSNSKSQSNSLGVYPCNFIDCSPVNANFIVVSQRPVGAMNPNFISQNQVVVPPFGFPLNPSVLIQMDEERSLSLVQLMANEGLVPSTEEEEKRRMSFIVLACVKKVAWQRGLPKEQIAETRATILTYGSYGLGVHGSQSDIDALCVGPHFTSMASRPEVAEIHRVKDAKVPLMRFKFDGILFDLPYARLNVLSVPDNLDVLNPFFLRDIDETSWKSLSGVRANKRILQLVPDLELHGFLGGVHMAILVAYVCQNHPNSSLNTLIVNFSKTFAFWPWPTPVMLQDPMLPAAGYPYGTGSLMPIWLPSSPHKYCHSNITRSTFYKIRTEFFRGHNITRDLMRPDFDWHFLFEPFLYSKKYMHFVKVYLSASNQDKLGDWVGWVKSRFHARIIKLEEVQGLWDPNPTEYIDMDVAEPNIVFYWGL